MKKISLQQKKRWLPPFFKTTYFKMLVNFYLPYMGAGIKITNITEDFRRFDVSMKLRLYNRNFVYSHFGGSLYAMADPFYMFILMENLGTKYIVWDKAAKIDFVKPGTGTVLATFEVNEEELNAIKEEVDAKGKMNKIVHAEIKSETGEVIARVEKVLYIRKLKE